MLCVMTRDSLCLERGGGYVEGRLPSVLAGK